MGAPTAPGLRLPTAWHGGAANLRGAQDDAGAIPVAAGALLKAMDIDIFTAVALPAPAIRTKTTTGYTILCIYSRGL